MGWNLRRQTDVEAHEHLFVVGCHSLLHHLQHDVRNIWFGCLVDSIPVLCRDARFVSDGGVFEDDQGINDRIGFNKSRIKTYLRTFSLTA